MSKSEGAVTFTADLLSVERRIETMSAGDRIALNGVKHTIVGGPINHDDGSITFYLSEPSDPCGGNVKGGPGCTCEPPL